MVEDKGSLVQPFFIREKEAARLISVSPSALKRWRQIGLVPHYNVKEPGTDHGVILYKPDELTEWIEKYRYRSN